MYETLFSVNLKNSSIRVEFQIRDNGENKIRFIQIRKFYKDKATKFGVVLSLNDFNGFLDNLRNLENFEFINGDNTYKLKKNEKGYEIIRQGKEKLNSILIMESEKSSLIEILDTLSAVLENDSNVEEYIVSAILIEGTEKGRTYKNLDGIKLININLNQIPACKIEQFKDLTANFEPWKQIGIKLAKMFMFGNIEEKLNDYNYLNNIAFSKAFEPLFLQMQSIVMNKIQKLVKQMSINV